MEIEVAALRAAGPECAPRVLEHCLADERPYFVMEYLAGKTIDQILAGKPLGEADTRKLATELAALLEQLHRAGVAHGDFRGQNVMAVQGSYFAIDFGCAKLRTDSLHEFRRGCHADLRHFANLVVRAGTGRAPFGDDVVNAIEKYQSGRPDLGAMSGTLRSVTRTLLTAKPWRLPTARGVHARLRRG
jgi:serine/threonine protein kinase